MPGEDVMSDTRAISEQGPANTGVSGRSSMTKEELADAIARKQR